MVLDFPTATLKPNSPTTPNMKIETLRDNIPKYQRWIDAARANSAEAQFPWYRYGSLSNFVHLDRLLTGKNRDIAALANGQKIVDIGAADGETAFALAREGFSVEIVDHGPTNMNGLRGARLLADHLNLPVDIHDVNLDSQFHLPSPDYGLAIFLGILYHLKNPYLVLESLAKKTRYAIVSTRIAKFAPDSTGIKFENLPMAYLLDACEANGDATNYWIFSNAGLKRIFHRTGWEVLDFITVGDLKNSNPIENNHDERAFALVKSRYFD